MIQLQQQTVRKSFSFEGKGLHTGKVARIAVKPAPVGYGIRFKRTDLGDDAIVDALAENVSSTARSTTITNGDVSVITIEHLMSGLTGMGIDNALIEIDNVEVPILDGSAKPYIDAIWKGGIVSQDAPREYIEIDRPVEVYDEKSGSSVLIEPADVPSFDVQIDFNSKVLGLQSAHWDMSVDYASEIGICRTFVFFHEIEYLFKKNGVTVIAGEAKLRKDGSQAVVDVTAADGEQTSYCATHTVIATGAKAASLPFAPIDGKKILGYRNALVPESLPASMAVIGSGAIGSELAFFYASLGVDVTIDGSPLPAYWADGLLVATSSGSTAYSLSVGGPIVLPESRVLIISPIAPHNLNVRPLIVPDTAEVRISLRSRDEKVLFTADNRSMEIDPDVKLVLSMARFSLKRVRLNGSNFINALTSKLFWGEDIRNGSDR